MNGFVKLSLYILCIPKSIFFNFYYLPWSKAIKLPIIISHKSKLQKLAGTISIPENAKTGKIKIGFGSVQSIDNKYSRVIWNLEKTGTIKFGNNIRIGIGSKLYVSGILSLGNQVVFSGDTSITCNKEISFGSECLIAWKTVFMDTDFHHIKDESNSCLNPDQSINIGDRVWVCARSTILKGVTIGNNSIISACANVTSSFNKDVIVGGNPAKEIGSMAGKIFFQ